MDDKNFYSKGIGAENEYTGERRTAIGNPEANEHSATSSRRRTVLWGLLVALLIIVVTWFLILRSLPGSVLYKMKVGALEAAVASVRFGTNAKTGYQISLLERRLEEMIQMQSKETLSGSDFADLVREMRKDIDALTTVLDTKTDALPEEDIVLFTSDEVSIIRASERIAELHQNASPDAQETENLRREVTDVHEAAIDDFLKSTAPEDLHTFIAERLALLESEISNSNVSPDVLSSVEEDVARVAGAMSRDDLTNAIKAALEAEQRIKTEIYLADTAAVK